jgi:hypothetical protein
MSRTQHQRESENIELWKASVQKTRKLRSGPQQGPTKAAQQKKKKNA